MMESDELRRLTERLIALDAFVRHRDTVLEDLVVSGQVLADEATAARVDRSRNATEAKAGHEAAAQRLAEVRADLDRLIAAATSERVELARQGAAVEVLQQTNKGLWRLLIAGASIGSAVLVFVLVTLLWLYADSHGQDASRAFDAAAGVTNKLVPTSGVGATPSEESTHVGNPDG